MMCERASTFEQTGIRFPEDTPVVIPCLQQALTILAQQEEDPDVFQSLLYFFSILISSPPLRSSSDSRHIMSAWTILRKNLDNPYGLCHGSIQARKQVDAVIDQLDPVATFQQVQQLAHACLRGSATSRCSSVGEEYTFINRGHDWLVRCAFGLDIPSKWKVWLQLMYEKQPYKILDLPSFGSDEEDSTFIGSLHTAASIGGFVAMIPVIKFWLRQALTIVQVWDIRLRGDDDEVMLMPTYDWCVAAYQKMWHRFKNEVRNPLSDYPYAVREEFFHIHFMRVFEECWQWVVAATQGTNARDFDPFETRVAIYKYALTLTSDEFQPLNPDTQEELEKAFGRNTETNGYLLLAESPVIYVDNLENDLRPRPILYDGLCGGFYPHLLNMTEAEYEAMSANRSSDSDSGDDDYEEYADQQDDYELVPLEDVEVEAFGQWINIDRFTQAKKPEEGDFCTICQDAIDLDESGEQRCLVPVTCSDTFHAECLDAWVNSAARLCNHCPHCQTQMTELQRPTREVYESNEDMTI